MVADATQSRRAPARQLGVLRLRVALIGPALDAKLAAGADPDSSPELYRPWRPAELRGAAARARHAL